MNLALCILSIVSEGELFSCGLLFGCSGKSEILQAKSRMNIQMSAGDIHLALVIVA